MSGDFRDFGDFAPKLIRNFPEILAIVHRGSHLTGIMHRMCKDTGQSTALSSKFTLKCAKSGDRA
jgi:hypothetical protein